MESSRSTSQAVKAPKKSPLLQRTTVVIFAVFCGLYMFSICIKQTRFSTASNLLVIYDRPCNKSVFKEEELPYLHFPKPKTFRRKECACNPVQFFVILSMQRSGSGWFETLLNSHINISSNGEIFGAKDRRTNASRVVQGWIKFIILTGFLVHPRRNALQQLALSGCLIKEQWKNHKEVVEYFKRRSVSAQILAQYKPKFNTTYLVTNLKEEQGIARRGLEMFESTRHIVLYYEAIVRNRAKLVNVLEFLKVPYRDLTSRQVKIHSGPLSQQVSNWEDV